MTAKWSKRLSGFWRRLRRPLKGEAPYRFLVRGWSELGDIDLAAGLLDTQYFDRNLVPQPLPVGELRSVAVLAPHQDDEVIGAGGMLLLAKAAGVRTDILFVTDGRPKKPNVHGTPPEEVVRIRARESARVCELLGARPHYLGIDNVRIDPGLDHLDRLAEFLREAGPQVLLVPWLLDTPKHRLVNHLLWLAHRRCPLPDCEVWGYQVHNTLLPNGYVDITAVIDAKRSLLEIYASQMAHYRYDHMSIGMAAWNCRFVPDYKADPALRYAEIFCALPLKEHLGLIERFYLPDLDATYRGLWVAEGMKRLHGMVDGNAG